MFRLKTGEKSMTFVPLGVIPFFVPLLQTYNFWSLSHPHAYSQHESAKPSPHESKVKEVARNILTEESREGKPFSGLIQESIAELPYSEEEKDIAKLVEHRFKVVTMRSDTPLHSIGKGFGTSKFYVGVDPEVEESALEWFTAREVSFFLRGDLESLYARNMLTSWAAACLSTILLRPSILTSLGLVMMATAACHIKSCHTAEVTADAFANNHSSEDSRMRVIATLETQKKGNIVERMTRYLFGLSETDRIAKIQESLKATV